jgi:hypothetical protein
VLLDVAHVACIARNLGLAVFIVGLSNSNEEMIPQTRARGWRALLGPTGAL